MSLVLYNPIQGTQAHVPQLPDYWVKIHESATTASVVSGAFTYALTHMIGTTTTRIASGSLSVAGLLVAHGAQWIAGDTTAESIQKRSQTAAHAVESLGETITNLTSAVTSTAAAATVGSTFLVGKMIHQLYQGFRQKEEPITAQPIQDADFVIYDCSEPTNSTPLPSSSPPELSEQIPHPDPVRSATNGSTAPSSGPKKAKVSFAGS